MIINEEIRTKANIILAKRKEAELRLLKEKEYIDTCFEAGICPNCGCDIIITEKFDETHIKCSKNEEHYKKYIYKSGTFD